MSLYQPNVPLAIDATRKSAVDLRNNFQVVQESFNNDHVSLTDADIVEADRGKHAKLTLPQVATPGGPAATEMQVYAKENTGSSVTDIYAQDGTPTEYRLTSGPYLNAGLRLEAWCFLDLSYTPNNNGGKVTAMNVLERRVTKPDGSWVMVPLASSNITTDLVVIDADNTAGRINFAPNLSTANYFWMAAAYNNREQDNRNGLVGPWPDDDYGDSVKTSSFLIKPYTPSNGAFGSHDRFTKKIMFQFYTVAP